MRNNTNKKTDIPPSPPPVEVSTKIVKGEVRMRGGLVARKIDKEGNVLEVKRLAG